MVNYAMRHCQSAGIDSFAINTHHLPHCWDEAYPDKTFDGSSISFFHEKQLLETGGGIKNISSYIKDEPLLVYNGDILTDLNLQELTKFHSESGNIATLALFPSGPNCNVAVDGKKVVDLRNARGIHPGTHQFTGIYCIEPEILDLIPANEKISIVPAFLKLAEQGKLGAFVSEDAKWFDLGTRDSYFEAHEIMRGSADAIHPTAQIHPSAQINTENCVIGANCIIEKDAKLDNTIVWSRAAIKQSSDLTRCIVRQHAEGTHTNKDL